MDRPASPRPPRVASGGGVIGFFLYGGIGMAALGATIFSMGGIGGIIPGSVFIMIGVIWAAVALGLRYFYSRMVRRAQEEQHLFETGRRATAVVESVETTGVVLNRVNQQIVLRLRVQPRGEPEFTYQRKMYVPFNGLPRTGDLIEVAYDPNDRTRVALQTDWRLNTAGGQLLVLRRPGDSVPVPAGMQAGAMPPAAFGASNGASNGAGTPEQVIQQLERLSRLRADGTLTHAEFEAQKARVLAAQQR